ncbi:hypothetical protein [Terrarubrum flagellatum]|uniref:hypothetical protein n=1 Tax=Terrirubrum flagellatum TaxID=2895980 RepID=UPI0031455BAD
MLTGRDALLSIERAISGARADESSLGQALQSATADAARLMQAETDGFRALARAKLDAMTQSQIVGELDATEKRALTMIEDARRKLAGLAERQAKTQAALDRAEAAKHDRDEELAQALRALDDFRHAAAERVKSDPVWQTAVAAIATAESIAANADKKASTAEADLAEKGKPYESDPLFMYLWSKKHDQSEDKSGYFVRFFDRKVASLIGYRDARANYAMLREIPARLREHANAKQADVDAAKQRVADVERQALVTGGVEPLEAKAAAAQAAVTAAAGEVEANTAELRRIDAERAQTTGADGYDKAVDFLTEALTREDLQELYDKAARTPAKADDRAVAAIAAARSDRQKANDEAARIREQIRQAASRRADLEGARDRARRQGYDSPMGTLNDNVDLGQILGGILSGAVRGGALDDIFRGNYNFPTPRSDPNFGGRRSAPSWPGPIGGDSGSFGGVLGGGNDDRPSGGGWRTGGSF